MNLSSEKIKPLLITAVNIAARAVHLVFFIVIGNKYGSNTLTDNVITLLAPLVVLSSVATGAADSVAMPVFHKVRNRNDAACIYDFFSKKIIIYISFVSILICSVSSFLYKNNDYFLVFILFLIPVFASLSALKSGILNASNRFNVAVSGPLFGATAATFFLFISPVHIYSFAASFLIFEAVKLSWLSFFKDISSGGSRLLKSNLSEKITYWGYRNAKVQLLASFIMALIYPVDIWFAKSTNEVGAVTFVEYANKLWNVIPLLFTGHIAITYASLSKAASAAEGTFKKINIHSIALRYLFIGTITCVIIILFSDYFINLLFGSGRIIVQQQAILSDLLKSYLIGAGFYIGGLVYVRALSAAGRMDMLLAITSFSFICNIFGDFILIRISGLNGIGIATSLVYTSNFFLLVFAYEKNRLAV